MDVRQDDLGQDEEQLDCIDRFIKIFNQIKSRKENYIFLHLNIKNFRYFNTKYGIAGGNEILELVFNRIQSLLGEEEYLVRYFADNFCILLKFEDEQELLYGRMAEWVDGLYRIDDHRISRNLFVSMGLYKIDDDKIEFEEAYNLANLSRKSNENLESRNHGIELYNTKILNHYMNRMDLEEKTAEAYKNYGFTTYLQPKVDLKTEKIIGAEALIRWFDDEGNMVPLYKFLPILNQNDYIILLDLDTFDNVCQLLDDRYKQNKSIVPVSFNVSKSHFNDPEIMKDFTSIFEKYNIPKNLIEMELMESISLDNTEKMKQIIKLFKEYGFTCALDDFGNGYSSFGVLLNAQIDVIKMDRQFFIDNLNGDSRLIIKTIVDLIHSLNMQIVAEGVELPEHIEYLKECGCEAVQGYYYYKPMPVEEFVKLLDEQDKEK